MLYGFILLLATSFPPEAKLSPGTHATLANSHFLTSPADSIREKNARFMLLPILFRSPETGFAFGVLPQLIFRTGSSSNPSTLRLDSYYTQNNQYHILLRTSNWVRNDNLQITSRLSLKNWPTTFYGIGNDTPEDLKETFTESLFEAEGAFRTRVKRHFFVGLGGKIRYAEISDTESGGMLVDGIVAGGGNTFILGVDAGLVYDTRDNLFFPSSGNLHELNVFLSPKSLGSDLSFMRTSADLRKYVSIYKNHVLALRAAGSFTTGDVPFRMMPSVGDNLRGYPAPRYINQHAVSVQLEYRIVPLLWRIGLVFFAGTGDVFDGNNYIDGENLKHMAGFGLRYVFFRDERINIRFDVSFGRNSMGDYLNLTEAY